MKNLLYSFILILMLIFIVLSFQKQDKNLSFESNNDNQIVQSIESSPKRDNDSNLESNNVDQNQAIQSIESFTDQEPVAAPETVIRNKPFIDTRSKEQEEVCKKSDPAKSDLPIREMKTDDVIVTINSSKKGEFITFLNYSHFNYSEDFHPSKDGSNVNLRQDVNFSISKATKLKNKIQMDMISFDNNIKFLDITSDLGFRVGNWNTFALNLTAGGFYSNSYVKNNKYGFDDLWGPKIGLELLHFPNAETPVSFSFNYGVPFSTTSPLTKSAKLDFEFKYPFSKHVFLNLEYDLDKFQVNASKVHYDRFLTGIGFSW